MTRVGLAAQCSCQSVDRAATLCFPKRSHSAEREGGRGAGGIFFTLHQLPRGLLRFAQRKDGRTYGRTDGRELSSCDKFMMPAGPGRRDEEKLFRFLRVHPSTKIDSMEEKEREAVFSLRQTVNCRVLLTSPASIVFGIFVIE